MSELMKCPRCKQLATFYHTGFKTDTIKCSLCNYKMTATVAYREFVKEKKAKEKELKRQEKIKRKEVKKNEEVAQRETGRPAEENPEHSSRIDNSSEVLNKDG